MGTKAELNEWLKNLPSVEAVLTTKKLVELEQHYRRDVLKRITRSEIDRFRRLILDGELKQGADAAAITTAVAQQLTTLSSAGLTSVVNATGVILHTNLGRAVLGQTALDAAIAAGSGYCDLEFDLSSGGRSHRDSACEPLLKALTGCEAATVVNNCAAAVLLVINTLAEGKKVITSRGELVEIGGAFRVPDVVETSGAELTEVGTTNRTRIADYENALADETGLLLKTHTSNYRVRGFTEEASTTELVELGKKHQLPVFVDLGSGYIEPEAGPEIDEPGLLGALAEGPDIVSFSGDKLLGGPQAGIIVGKKKYIDRIRKNPLWRALRIDKLTASALSATLAAHLHNPDHAKAGIAAMLEGRSADQLAKLAANLAKDLSAACPHWQFETADGTGSYGGGSLPDQDIPSRLVLVHPEGLTPYELHEKLRLGDTPVAGYPKQGAYVLNCLSLLPGDNGRIVTAFTAVAGE